MENEIIEVRQADMLEAINAAEINQQIATAKQYPRDLSQVLNTIKTIATMDKEVAGDCFYALRRQGSLIEGLSVRMAEIIAGAWGNLRVASRIVGNDGKTITAQAVCHDLQSNVAICTEVKRRITDKYGKTFSEDMQVVTGNAACSIAFRNAVLKVVPKAVTKKVCDEVKQVAMGQAMDLESMRQNCIQWFTKIGVDEKAIYEYFGISCREEIDSERLMELRGIGNAIQEGTTTAQEAILNVIKERKAAELAAKEQKTNKEKVQAAMNNN